MKSLRNKFFGYSLTIGIFLLTGIQYVMAAGPRLATNPSGRSLDQVGDSALDYFFSDIRPWVIVVLIIGGCLGGWLGGRFRYAIAGTCAGAILTLMALPTIIAKIFGWM